MYFLLLLQIGDVSQSPIQDSLPTLDLLIEKVSSSRIKKMPYQLTIAEKDFSSVRPPAKSALRHIWWDTQHQRVDWFPTLSEYPEGSGVPVRMVQGINIEKIGYGLEYDEEVNLIARFKPMLNFEKNKFNFIVNPANFGHSFGGIWRDESFTRLITNFFSEPTTITWDSNSESKFIKLSRLDNRGFVSELLIDPRKDYEVISILFKGENIRESTRSQLKNWDGHWYPEQITYEQWIDEKLTTKKEIRIQKAIFQQPIPPETFTLAGIKMLPRHAIRVDDKLRLMRVDDGKLVPFEDKVTTSEPIPPPTTMPVRVPEPGEWRFNPWMLSIGVLLGILAVIIVILLFRSRSAKS